MNALLALLISLNIVSKSQSTKMTTSQAVGIAVSKNICSVKQATDLTKVKVFGGLDPTEGITPVAPPKKK